ncbi:arsH-like protein [Cupriavidus necator]|uniref:ArsH-like protein n=1 Tax=Cupriavidus necator TaxID=106590 RepID=A0A1K0JJM2_CUPNE|nr:arsH-like protein [Cupriavidus necator]
MSADLPNIVPAVLDTPDLYKLEPARVSGHAPRILLLYGSLRETSFSRLLVLEAERILRHFGAETRVFDPHGLPLADSVPADHPKVAELRDLSEWSEGQVWCSPERHGTLTAVFKNQIDWLPLDMGGIRPTQGRTHRCDAGLRWVTVFQRRQCTTRAGPMDADGDHSEPVVGSQGVSRVRRGWSHEAVFLL